MDDLISRAAAIEYLMTNMGWHDEDGYEVDDADEKRNVITDLVNGIPAVDAVPVVHARWKSYCVPHWTKRYDDNGDPEYKYHDEHVCSACGRRTVIKENFCPKCGAKMDGDANG